MKKSITAIRSDMALDCDEPNRSPNQLIIQYILSRIITTATRDMQQLMEIGAFKRLGEAGGRSTRYQVNL